MEKITNTRRSALALIGASPLLAASWGRAQTQEVAAARPPLTLVSRHLQWAEAERGIEAAREAGFPAIAWSVRSGAHIEPENVERELPRIVELTRQAGLSTPMIITSINGVDSPRVEAILETMQGLGISKYRAGTARYDFDAELEPQYDRLRRRIADLAAFNERYDAQAMFHTHSSGSIGGSAWDIWLLVRDLPPEQVSLNYDIGHTTVKGGPGWRESLMAAHRHVGALSLKDFQWARRADAAAAEWPWRIDWVRPGDGMVNFRDAFRYLRSIGFSGPFEQYYEYHVPVADGSTMNMLGTDYRRWELEIPPSEYIRYMREDVAFYRALMDEIWSA